MGFFSFGVQRLKRLSVRLRELGCVFGKWGIFSAVGVLVIWSHEHGDEKRRTAEPLHEMRETIFRLRVDTPEETD